MFISRMFLSGPSRRCRSRHTSGTAGITLGLLLGALHLGAPTAHADVYKFVDKYGVVHLTDTPLGPGYKLILKTKKAKRKPRANGNNQRRYTPIIDRLARRARMDRALVHAVVSAESAYNPVAVSRAGAVGLMQLMPGTAKRYGVRDRKDPAQNVWGGVRYLRDLLAQFQDVSLALAAYNAGEHTVIKYGHKIPPYPETQQYVRRVLKYYRRNLRTS